MQGVPKDRNAGFAEDQEQVWGFDLRTAISSLSFFAPGAKVFYVDPNNSQAVDFGNLGEDPTVPLATVERAIALCRDHRGDTIVVGPNDAWQYSPQQRATAIVESLTIPATKGGIRIVGAAPDALGCQWEPADDNEVCITIHSMDVLIEGFVFDAPSTTGNTAIVIEWDGVTNYGESTTVRNCYFEGNLDYGITMDYSWNNQVYNNYFSALGTAAIFNTSVGGDPDYCNIHGNQFMDCTAAIDMTTTDNCFIHANLIYGDGTGTNNFIDFTGGSDNLVSDNWLACTIAQYDVTCSDATSGAWLNNHCIDGDTTANPI